MKSKIIQIEVTQDDIDNGVGEDCNLCAVALAANRLLCNKVQVNRRGYLVDLSGGRILRPLDPDTVARFVRHFDRDPSRVSPCTFEYRMVED